jgi:glycerophosphoryl diester phosphodiesterase
LRQARGGRGVVIALAAAALAATALLAPATADAAVSPNPWLDHRFLNIAHQGGEDEAPSDTIYALRSAVREANADMLEIDVHLTQDGHLVVLHDDTVNRTTEVTADRASGQSQVRDLTLAQIQELDAGYTFPSYNKNQPADHYPFRGVRTGNEPPPAGYSADDFRIPTLNEVLDRFRSTPINIEIKQPKTPTGTGGGCVTQNRVRYCDDPQAAVPIAEALAELLNQRRYAARCDIIVASFAQEPLEAFHALAPDVYLSPSQNALIAWGFLNQPFSPDVVALQVPPTFQGLNVPEFLLNDKQAHEQGYAVQVWGTNETPAQWGSLVDLGVDGIMTAAPRELEEFLDQQGVARPRGRLRCHSPPAKPVRDR